MEVIFLGTNGWYDTNTGNTICTLIKTNNQYILLDAGYGINKLDQFIKRSNPIYLFISHFHLDHICGLHVLNKFKFDQGINIYGRKGINDILNRLLCNPFTVPLSDLRYKVNIHEIALGQNRVPLSFECLDLLHPHGCLGFRFCIDEKVIAYCSDTGICDNLLKLAKDADLLITECSLKPGESDPKWPHLSPEDAINIAKKAKVKKLALVHFDASRYRTKGDRLAIAELETKFDDLVIGMDDMSINL
jgi:ribonuclease BN (tRNA processing enzyme)